MLTINLLPEASRKAPPSPVEQLHRTPLTWVVGGLLVLIPLALWVPLQVRERQLRALNAAIATLTPRKVAVDQLQQTMRELRTQEAAFRGLSQGDGLWARRLNRLSDVTPGGVWLTDLALDEGRGLVIQGSAIAQPDPEEVAITRMVHDLKASPDFASAVKDIQIDSIKRVPEGELEVVQFTLSFTPADHPAP